MVIWLTGLPGSGKTTIALEVVRHIRGLGLYAELLDGDELRRGLCRDLGFSRRDRSENAYRVAFLAKLLARNDVYAVVSLITPYASDRQAAREMIGDKFKEVYVQCSPETCRKRDPKGMWKKAVEGKLKGLTGYDDPYDVPVQPDLTVDTEKESVDDIVDRILQMMGILIR